MHTTVMGQLQLRHPSSATLRSVDIYEPPIECATAYVEWVLPFVRINGTLPLLLRSTCTLA